MCVCAYCILLERVKQHSLVPSLNIYCTFMTSRAFIISITDQKHLQDLQAFYSTGSCPHHVVNVARIKVLRKAVSRGDHSSDLCKKEYRAQIDLRLRRTPEFWLSRANLYNMDRINSQMRLHQDIFSEVLFPKMISRWREKMEERANAARSWTSSSW